LSSWREAGATIEFFSPLAGEHPGPNVAGVYLGGGYPELYGERLAQNVRLWERLRELRDRDAPIYAECGGFMALMQGLIDCEGRYWPMAGIIPGLARMTNTLAALGYRYATRCVPTYLPKAAKRCAGMSFGTATGSVISPSRMTMSPGRCAVLELGRPPIRRAS